MARLFDLSLDTLLLEGNTLVKNLKKQAELKSVRQLLFVTGTINIIFLLIITTQNQFGQLSLFASLCLSLATLLNLLSIVYFSRRVTILEDNRLPSQQLADKSRWLLALLVTFLVL